MNSDNRATKSPFSFLNIRLFIAFRLFFNARLYYPVFTVLFLDYGLTLEQFAILNSVWALTIVLAEVPSGAMADIIGRKKLLLITSSLMILEISLISFVPLGNSSLIFTVFLVNRILSGLAEAMASGADEAIAYDTLVEKGNPQDWPKVLSLQMRIRSIGSMISVAIGAFIYDSSAMNKMFAFLGSDIHLSQQTTMRFPLYVTLAFGFCAFFTVCMMSETNHQESTENYDLRDTLKQTLNAGRWILATPFALAIILIAMSYDHALRMVVTMTSQYYRQIGLPDASFGLIGASIAVLGLFTPKVAEYMAAHFGAQKNIIITGTIGFIGLCGITTFHVYSGLISIACIFTGLTLTSFFTSHYLNHITSSKMRATVLSFKGLAFNFSYGVIGVLFATLMSSLRNEITTQQPHLAKQLIEDQAFQSALSWFPPYFFITVLLLFLFWGKKLAQPPPPPENDYYL